ncbi:MAG: glycosyltransferase family 4 protein [Acidobacteriota bacterium]|nr:MAG: glycosyltransferase family 4 protein [Acidobacteriota bacterium]
MSRPLNFLHLTTFYPPYSFGGDAMYLYRLCHALGDAGHQVDVIHCIDSYYLLHPAEPEIQFSPHPSVRTHGLRSGLGPLSPLLTQQTGRPWLKTRRIDEVLRSRRFDVVHFHNISLLGPGILELEQPGIESVKIYTTHEHWLICPMHVLWKFNSRPCEKPECLRCMLKGGRPPQLWRYTSMLERAGSHVDCFVSPSRFTARMHAERGFPYLLGHLPYFIDRVDGDWRNPGPRPRERPYFLFVGRLEAIKGLQNLIRIWDRVDDCDLLVAGTGSYRDQLEAMAGANPRIRFLGALPQRELGNLFFHALACLVPSLTYETFGIIIIEAFARKTPVIVHDLGALPEVVHESGGGFVYRNDDELLSAIRRLVDSPAMKHDLGERGYQAFLKLWSKEAHLALYFDLLNRTASTKFGRIPWNHE